MAEAKLASSLSALYHNTSLQLTAGLHDAPNMHTHATVQHAAMLISLVSLSLSNLPAQSIRFPHICYLSLCPALYGAFRDTVFLKCASNFLTDGLVSLLIPKV